MPCRTKDKKLSPMQACSEIAYHSPSSSPSKTRQNLAGTVCLWVDLPANQIGPSPPVSPCSRRFGLWRPAVLATAISVSGRSSSPETGPQIDAGRTIGSCSSELVYSHLLSNATDARVVRQDKRAADRQSQ
ncbi:hypothetical protein MGG_16877 [Pyricularia oryzae 70-15]|uniref:Uncharacterized protein n=1 Tax=Pyricularia oryzae (strain 70-15 / ATCC MYA-4617 / FGSC 8958) TaxID=242507 RepID=G4N4S0_PYRO7|nr:uncharacterized protein MGG_16877 [Pyricularia oryzae 70-15]EHA52885.1 hypothetical protein MGG_16877 [Pyricularia oryzae 70-15]